MSGTRRKIRPGTRQHRARFQTVFYAGMVFLLGACSGPIEWIFPPTPTPTATATSTPTSTATPTATYTSTFTPTSTNTPTSTFTPTITWTPSITPTPTFDFPDVTVMMNAHCRYGPGVAYLHHTDLWIGDTGIVWNRNVSGTWLWVKWDKDYAACWVAASVLEVEGDVFTVVEYYHPLPKSTLYGPVQQVWAERSGDTVVVNWKEIWMTEDDFRGYMVQAQVCQNGHLIDTAFHSDHPPITVPDDRNCSRDSNGVLYAVEKHGYTDPVTIPWPNSD